MKILIISSYFPPLNSIASLRPYSWAKYWSRAGHEVTVLTTKKKKYGNNLKLPIIGFKIIETSLKIPFSKANEIAKKAELNALLDKKSLSSNKLFANILNCLRLLYFWFVEKTGCFNTCRFPDWHDIWARQSKSFVANEEWDLVVSSGGPYSVHRIGLWLKKQGKTKKWVADWRDLWVNNHIFKGIFLFWLYEIYLENKFHKHADLITTVSEPMAEVLRKKTKKRVEIVYNGFDPEDYLALPKQNIFPNDKLVRIVYTGTIYKGFQDPSPLFKAIKLLEAKGVAGLNRLRIVFAGNSQNAQELAKEYGVVNYCDFLGLIVREDALRMQRDGNVLLFLEFNKENVKGVLTGKLFEYLFANTPIWAIGIDEKSLSAKLILDSGRGKVLGTNVEKIAVELQALMTKREKELSIKQQLVSIAQFTREYQANRLLSM